MRKTREGIDTSEEVADVVSPNTSGSPGLLGWEQKVTRPPGPDTEGQRREELHQSRQARWTPENPAGKGPESGNEFSFCRQQPKAINTHT